ncbi:hypothetical protein H5410_015105 [Solanum commersonii]|uniref:RNase H type-1 domain-containing protein n=1 Tax=Solanum commersonii TaxID=4109 RepID=A0A9J5ZSU8_SOLCO|nr:hypothetical protein H5410_015105 [Solanum commersonii]
MNAEAESMDIQDTLEYCQEKNLNEWIIPWEITEKVEKIIMIMQLLDACFVHTFKEDNTLADALANQVVESQGTEMYMDFQELPANMKRNVYMDKAQVPTS